MVTSCCIKGCGNESYAGCNISFHSAPKNKDTLQKWLNATGFESLANKHVCSKHFTKEDYVNRFSTRLLKPGAVPSLSLKKFTPILIQGPTNNDSDDSESDAKNKGTGQKNDNVSIHCFSEKDGKITHIYENKLSGSILHSFDEEIDEYINSVPVNNEEVISDTDSIFDPPSIVYLKQQLQKEKVANEKYRDEIQKLKRQNRSLSKRNLRYKSLIKCLKQQYIRKIKDPNGRIVVEFLPKTD